MATTSNRSFAVRAQTIPLRLTEEERSMLRVLEGALSVSEYTDKVDVLRGFGNRSSRIEAQLVDTFAVLSGLMLAVRPQSRKLIQGRELSDNAAWFERIFEVGRRHKIMNPDTMRSSYGKLMHLLQDAAMPEIIRLMGADDVVVLGHLARNAAEADKRGLDNPFAGGGNGVNGYVSVVHTDFRADRAHELARNQGGGRKEINSSQRDRQRFMIVNTWRNISPHLPN